jgi:probable F420-dependent oxidoreductase
MRLGQLGAWSYELRQPDRGPELAAELEACGYGTLWFTAGSRGGFEVADRLLDATEKLTVAFGLATIWRYPAEEVAEGCRLLESRYPERFLLGLGVSHGSFLTAVEKETYRFPIAAMKGYLDSLDAAALREVSQNRRVLGALGERMLELSAARALGAHPYLTTPTHTKLARAILGEGPLLAPEQAAVLCSDGEKARSVARSYLEGYLGLPNYTKNLLRTGFDEVDIVQGGSNRLVDALVAHGSEETIAARLWEHLAHGADHVCVQLLSDGTDPAPFSHWRAVADAFRKSGKSS